MWDFGLDHLTACKPLEKGCRPCCNSVPKEDTVKVQLDLIEQRESSLQEEEAVTTLKAAQAALLSQKAIAAAAIASSRQRARLQENGNGRSQENSEVCVGDASHADDVVCTDETFGKGCGPETSVQACHVCGEEFLLNDSVFCRKCGIRKLSEATLKKSTLPPPIDDEEEDDEEDSQDGSTFIPWRYSEPRSDFAFFAEEYDDMPWPPPAPQRLEAVQEVAESEFETPRPDGGSASSRTSAELREGFRETPAEEGQHGKTSDEITEFTFGVTQMQMLQAEAQEQQAAVASTDECSSACPSRTDRGHVDCETHPASEQTSRGDRGEHGVEEEPTEEQLEAQRQREEQEAQADTWIKEFLTCHGYSGVNAKRTRLLRSKYALHTAVKHNSADAVRLLLWAGADQALKSSAGLTPRQLAEKMNYRASHEEVLAAFSAQDAAALESVE